LKKKIFGFLRFLFFFGAALFLLYLAFRGIDPKKVLTDLKKANYAWLLLTIPLGILSHWVRAMRWNLLIHPLGFRPKTLHTFYAVMTGYLANLAIPRLGEVARCGSLTKTDHVPFDKLIGTVIVERAVDLMMVILLFLITFLVKIKFFGNFFSTQILQPFSVHTKQIFTHHWVWIYIGLGILFIAIALRLFWKKIKALTLVNKIVDFISGIVTGLKTIFQMKQTGRFILLSVLIWFLYYLTAWLVVYTLPETSFLMPVDGLFLLVAGSLGMMVPVQGGIGAYHWILSRAVAIYGISQESGLALATIAHESQTLIILLLGTWSLLMVVFIRNREKSSNQ
jgi:glycosyltransferase 2 family protein